MMIDRIRKIINEFRSRDDQRNLQNENIKAQNAELEWAHIYHDTIRGRDWLEKLGISPGRWAGNYSFYYILVRILSDYKPKTILELGLGESSKVISSFVQNEFQDTAHVVIEQDKEWIDVFRNRFVVSENSSILHLPLTNNKVQGFDVNGYENIAERISSTFDFYVVDGPFGSERYSRYDICLLAERLTLSNEFIILIDDYNRQGEIDTAITLINILKSKGINLFTSVYAGTKSQFIITTQKYRFACSL